MRYKIILASLVAVFLLLPVVAGAQSFLNESYHQTENLAANVGFARTSNDAAQADLIDAIVYFIKVALGLIGTVVTVIVMYAGWRYMTAGGNQEQITEALKWLKNGAIGLAIILSAYAISSFVLSSILKAVLK